jgi:hypothetical protein
MEVLKHLNNFKTPHKQGHRIFLIDDKWYKNKRKEEELKTELRWKDHLAHKETWNLPKEDKNIIWHEI